MHLVHGADLYFPQDRTDAGSLSLFREAIIRELNGHLSFVSWCVYEFTQLSQDIKDENPQLCQDIYKKSVKQYSI